ncbi:uncharacterized protein Z518_09416 [Rhinocladiella mackenziei CBS 650.93]|uniref:C2H2-type domain-containing protein n=1 Tax=Rhinocladiella mackenziei CBS 650.93 TaxID=1442369 RepID=A0A0D2IYJ9_9EURO|nr:uncharacterized protein Z518_09416 [Rhinocladiella mackenziei CBS 650.93]KIX01690.1 hypothetical protein Z518_09416 [Rhinocladiella mackenziei CBS 650.93]
MQIDSDDDFDPADDYEMVDSEIEPEKQIDDTPASTPPSTTTTIPRCRQKTLKCPWNNCDKAFNRQARLTEHIRSHTNTRPFKCPSPGCAKAFLRDSHLKHHVKSAHTEIRDYKCTWSGCDASFATGTRLRRHIQAHEAKEKFRCRGYDGCTQTFRKQDTLDRHILSAHQNIKPFPCPELDSVTGLPCTKAYDTAENLRTHQRTKHDPTRFSCAECMAQNATTQADSPDTHPENPIVASFATYGELQAHITIVHPPTCPYCPTSFTTNKELTRHLEIQHGILPPNKASEPASVFPCTHEGCGKKFTKKGNLNVHVKTVHENKRDFVCGQTEMALPEELNDQKDIVVYGCNRSFTSKASLEEHVRTAHLGLESKRMIREKKRKADRRADDDAHNPAPEGQTLKKRKARSDKGVKKSSAMTSLTGVAHDQSKMEARRSQPIADTGLETVMDDGEDTYLSGSMTMCGSQIFHYGSSYRYLSGQYPTLHGQASASVSLPEHENDDDDNSGSDNQLGRVTPPGMTDYEIEVDDNFFGHFEPEKPAYEYPSL